MKLFLITAVLLSVACAAPDSYAIPRGPTQQVRNVQNLGARDRGTTENFDRNRFSNQFDLQQRIPLRPSVNSNENFSRESDFSSFDNERNQNQVGFNRLGDSVFSNQTPTRGSDFAGIQQQNNVGLQKHNSGYDTDENTSEVDDFFIGEEPRDQVRSQHEFGNNNDKVEDRVSSGRRHHAVPVFDRRQFGNSSNVARFPSAFDQGDQINAFPINEQREVSQNFRGDRRGLQSVAPGQQTGEYLNNGQSRTRFDSVVNLNRPRFEQRDSRDFKTSPVQTNHRDENQVNFRGTVQNGPKNPASGFGNQGFRQNQEPADRAQNFRGTVNPCGQDEVVDFNGECVRQKITRNIFVYQKPETKEDVTNEVREQELSYNILFIKTSNERSVAGQNNEEKKTIVYVLNKQPTEEERKELEKDKHEVYFVNYKDGENPLLPHGSRLQAELNLSENGDSSDRFQQISGSSNQTPFNSFSQNFDAPSRRPVLIQDVSDERFTEERPRFGNRDQAVFFQNNRHHNNGAHREDLVQDQGTNFSSSFTNQKDRASVSGNNFHGQNLSQTEFNRPDNSNISNGNNDFARPQNVEDIGNGYEAPRA